MQDFFPIIHPFEAADLISYPNGLVVGHYNPIPGQLQGQVTLPTTTPVVTMSGCKLTAPALCSFRFWPWGLPLQSSVQQHTIF